MQRAARWQVPAYFDEEQREATMQAGRLAGLDTVRLLRCECSAVDADPESTRRACGLFSRWGQPVGWPMQDICCVWCREPVAAALAYGVSAQEDETVLVLDLGGGTFDVAILEVGGGTIEVLSTGGDPHLGTACWPRALTCLP